MSRKILWSFDQRSLVFYQWDGIIFLFISWLWSNLNILFWRNPVNCSIVMHSHNLGMGLEICFLMISKVFRCKKVWQEKYSSTFYLQILNPNMQSFFKMRSLWKTSMVIYHLIFCWWIRLALKGTWSKVIKSFQLFWESSAKRPLFEMVERWKSGSLWSCCGVQWPFLHLI